MPGCSPEYSGYQGTGRKNGFEDDEAVYGPNYSTGDVVGCGVNFQAGSVFFTKNGENLGEFQMFE